MSCCVGVSAIARCFFTRGGSLFVTRLVVTRPHLMACENAEETTPAMFRTVFALINRCISSFVMPPHLQQSAPFAAEVQGLISAIGVWSN